MVVGYHLVWTAYGWWLPNDPRGSSSHEIRVRPISKLGPLHEGRKKTQPKSAEIRRFYRDAEKLLNHALLKFNSPAVQIIADAFSTVVKREQYTCYACAIMPDHVHVLIRKHRDQTETMIANLQEESPDLRRIANGRSSRVGRIWMESVFKYARGYGTYRGVHPTKST